MKNYKFFLLLTFLIVSFKSFSQTVINTESNLNKIDSTFHLFVDGMGDYKKGNLDFFMIKSNLTIGSRVKEKNLLRLTFSNNYQKFNGNPFKNSISGQIRYNFFYNVEKHHSLFLFSQLGKSQRSMIDRRYLLGGGIRQRVTPSKNSGYIDLAYGAFYENEKYEDSKFLFQRNIVFNPKDANSYLYLAKIYKEKEDDKKEEKNLETTLLIDPANEEAILMLMEIGIKKTNYSKVKELSERFTKVCKNLCNENKKILETLDNIEPKNES